MNNVENEHTLQVDYILVNLGFYDLVLKFSVDFIDFFLNTMKAMKQYLLERHLDIFAIMHFSTHFVQKTT